MSDIPPKIPPWPPDPSSAGCLTVLLGLVGAVLLLPGLCAVIVGIRTIGVDTTHDVYNTIGFVKVGLVLGLFGVVLVWFAIRLRGR